MRTRALRPEFWGDSKMAALPLHTRMTYMGLWGLSDDAGYFEWNDAEIAAALWRFEDIKDRVDAVNVDMTLLQVNGRIDMMSCGKHGFIPTMKRHRIQSGRLTYNTQKEHDEECAGRRAAFRGISGNSMKCSLPLPLPLPLPSPLPLNDGLSPEEKNEWVKAGELLHSMEKGNDGNKRG